MQGYQRHTAPQGSYCPGALSLCLREEMACVGKEMGPSPIPTVPLRRQPELGRGRPAVPVSPGHVRPLHPYPPSRRRRR